MYDIINAACHIKNAICHILEVSHCISICHILHSLCDILHSIWYVRIPDLGHRVGRACAYGASLPCRAACQRAMHAWSGPSCLSHDVVRSHAWRKALYQQFLVGGRMGMLQGRLAVKSTCHASAGVMSLFESGTCEFFNVMLHSIRDQCLCYGTTVRRYPDLTESRASCVPTAQAP